MGPSLDTTIFATANMIWLFACHPDQWTLLRQQPDLMLNAINEVLRIETVIQGFSRVLTEDARRRRRHPAGRRPGADPVRLGQPRRAPVRGSGPLRHHPRQRVGAPGPRLRRALLPGRQPGPHGAAGAARRAAAAAWSASNCGRPSRSSTTCSTGWAPASWMSCGPEMALIEVEGLEKSFGVPVIDHLSFVVDAGEALGIVGPNGAGKTTLINLIAGELSPDAGRILYDGHDITRARPDVRAQAGIARTAQVPRPFEGLSVFENVLVGATFGTSEPRRAATDRAAAALEQAGMIDKANRAAASPGPARPQAARAGAGARHAAQGAAAGRDRRRADRGRGARADRQDPRDPRRRRHHRLDRTHRSRPPGRRRSASWR